MYLFGAISKDEIGRVLQLIQRIYFVFALLAGLAVLSLLIPILDDAPIPNEKWEAPFHFAIYVAIYLGLKNKKKWAVPLILFNSAFSTFFFVIQILTPAAGVESLLLKIVAALLCLFYVYQLFFFTKKEVRTFWGINKQVIFGE